MGNIIFEPLMEVLGGIKTSENFVSSSIPETQQPIKVIDNFLPENLYKEFLTHSQSMKFAGNWQSATNAPHGHWNCNHLERDSTYNLSDKSDKFNDEIARNIWKWASENIPELKDTILIRCYTNGYTFGTEGYFHKDSNRKNEKTMVLYLVDDEAWIKNWAGETVFADENEEIIKSVLPKRNRAVIFDSDISHCARAVSRIFMRIRKTFMFKVREKRTNNFEKLSRFLIEHKADEKNHEKGSLHDHLMRTYQLLEDKGAPEHVCFAGGLHSIFGTNVFKDNILTLKDRDIIVSQFGEKVFELSALFSIIQRAATIETPEGFEEGKYHLKLVDGNIVGVGEETLRDLRLMEGANLKDQDQLNEELFPKIYAEYTNYRQNV